jgi:hypothetical protein
VTTPELRGRLFRISEISSIGDCLEWFGSTTLVWGCRVFVDFAAFQPWSLGSV